MQPTTLFRLQQLATHICPCFGCVFVFVCGLIKLWPVHSFVAWPGKAGVACIGELWPPAELFISVCVCVCACLYVHTYTQAPTDTFFFIATIHHSFIWLNDRMLYVLYNDSLNRYGCTFCTTYSTMISYYLSCLWFPCSEWVSVKADGEQRDLGQAPAWERGRQRWIRKKCRRKARKWREIALRRHYWQTYSYSSTCPFLSFYISLSVKPGHTQKKKKLRPILKQN